MASNLSVRKYAIDSLVDASDQLPTALPISCFPTSWLASQAAIVEVLCMIQMFSPVFPPSWTAADNSRPFDSEIHCKWENHSNQNLQQVEGWFMRCYDQLIEAEEEGLPAAVRDREIWEIHRTRASYSSIIYYKILGK